MFLCWNFRSMRSLGPRRASDISFRSRIDLIMLTTSSSKASFYDPLWYLASLSYFLCIMHLQQNMYRTISEYPYSNGILSLKYERIYLRNASLFISSLSASLYISLTLIPMSSGLFSGFYTWYRELMKVLINSRVDIKKTSMCPIECTDS